MARLNSATKKLRRKKKVMALVTVWSNIEDAVSWWLELISCLMVFYIRKRSLHRRYIMDFYSKRKYIFQLVYESDRNCIEQLRMDRHTFTKLCSLLKNLGGLKETQNMMIDKQVAMFLHILAHHVKYRVIKFRFERSMETISRHFNSVLNVVIRLHGVLLKKPEPIPSNSTDERWKWFKNCLGALDGTYIKVKVPTQDKSRYRTRKGEIATNMLGVCSKDMQFIYVLPGWEGSAADSRMLREAMDKRNGFNVPQGYYYLVDAGYTNCQGFLAPYRGQRYHLNDWREGHQPTTPREFFNMKHSAARNVIERCFGLLKLRWAILRSPSFYPIKKQVRVILACCLLHNLIRQEMSIDPLEESLEAQEQVVTEAHGETITAIETSNEWSTWRDNLATHMFDEWRARRQRR